MSCDEEETKEERDKEREKIEGKKRLSPLRLFDSGTIFKLSASAYDAHVKSCRVDFRVHEAERKDLSEKRSECAPPPGTSRVK